MSDKKDDIEDRVEKLHHKLRAVVDSLERNPNDAGRDKVIKQRAILLLAQDLTTGYGPLYEQTQLDLPSVTRITRMLIDEVALTSMMLQDHTMELMRRSYTKNEDKASKLIFTRTMGNEYSTLLETVKDEKSKKKPGPKPGSAKKKRKESEPPSSPERNLKFIATSIDVVQKRIGVDISMEVLTDKEGDKEGLATLIKEIKDNGIPDEDKSSLLARLKDCEKRLEESQEGYNTQCEQFRQAKADYLKGEGVPDEDIQPVKYKKYREAMKRLADGVTSWRDSVKGAEAKIKELEAALARDVDELDYKVGKYKRRLPIPKKPRKPSAKKPSAKRLKTIQARKSSSVLPRQGYVAHAPPALAANAGSSSSGDSDSDSESQKSKKSKSKSSSSDSSDSDSES